VLGLGVEGDVKVVQYVLEYFGGRQVEVLDVGRCGSSGMRFGAPKDIQRSWELGRRRSAITIPSNISVTTAPSIPILYYGRVRRIVSQRFDVNNSPPPFWFFNS